MLINVKAERTKTDLISCVLSSHRMTFTLQLKPSTRDTREFPRMKVLRNFSSEILSQGHPYDQGVK